MDDPRANELETAYAQAADFYDQLGVAPSTMDWVWTQMSDDRKRLTDMLAKLEALEAIMDMRAKLEALEATITDETEA